MGVQSCVYREYRSGLSTQPWGEPVLRVRVEEQVVPTLTVCGRSVRKFLIQAQIEGGESDVGQLVHQDVRNDGV